VVFYILLIIHCSNFWKWFIVPFALMIFERIYNFYRIQSVNYGETYIKDVNLLSSNVTQLIVTRPPNFKFRSGDYIFIKIPTIARFEWHPFTISSAPELKGKLFRNAYFRVKEYFFLEIIYNTMFLFKDELWLHVRSLGNWTNKLYEYFSDYTLNKNTESSGIGSGGPAVYNRKMSNMGTIDIFT